MAVELSMAQFEQAVAEAIQAVPSQLLELIENCVILVQDEPPAGEQLFGYYDGVPLSERGLDYFGVLPDRVVIFRQPHLAEANSHDELIDEITTTVVHEIAHHFGIEDERLHDLGWA